MLCVRKAVSLDKRMKLISEDLSSISERQHVQSQFILSYLVALGRLMQSVEIQTKPAIMQDLFQTWFILNV